MENSRWNTFHNLSRSWQIVKSITCVRDKLWKVFHDRDKLWKVFHLVPTMIVLLCQRGPEQSMQSASFHFQICNIPWRWNRFTSRCPRSASQWVDAVREGAIFFPVKFFDRRRQRHTVQRDSSWFRLVYGFCWNKVSLELNFSLFTSIYDLDHEHYQVLPSTWISRKISLFFQARARVQFFLRESSDDLILMLLLKHWTDAFVLPQSCAKFDSEKVWLRWLVQWHFKFGLRDLLLNVHLFRTPDTTVAFTENKFSRTNRLRLCLWSSQGAQQITQNAPTWSKTQVDVALALDRHGVGAFTDRIMAQARQHKHFFRRNAPLGGSYVFKLM